MIDRWQLQPSPRIPKISSETCFPLWIVTMLHPSDRLAWLTEHEWMKCLDSFSIPFRYDVPDFGGILPLQESYICIWRQITSASRLTTSRSESAMFIFLIPSYAEFKDSEIDDVYLLYVWWQSPGNIWVVAIPASAHFFFCFALIRLKMRFTRSGFAFEHASSYNCLSSLDNFLLESVMWRLQ